MGCMPGGSQRNSVVSIYVVFKLTKLKEGVSHDTQEADYNIDDRRGYLFV